MRVEVMQHFGLTLAFNQAGYYETEHHKELMKDIRGAIGEGRLIAVCGVVGSGKTVLLRRLQQALERLLPSGDVTFLRLGEGRWSSPLVVVALHALAASVAAVVALRLAGGKAGR